MVVPFGTESEDKGQIDSMADLILGNTFVLRNINQKLKHFSYPQAASINSLLKEYLKLLNDTPWKSPLLAHDILLKDLTPIRQAAYLFNKKTREFLKEE